MMNLLAGEGHQGEGRKGSRPLFTAKYNLPVPSHSYLRQNAINRAMLEEFGGLGIHQKRIEALPEYSRTSFKVPSEQAVETLGVLSLDGSDGSPSMHFVQNKNGVSEPRCHSDFDSQFEQGAVVDPYSSRCGIG